jgi:energy-coupling factor transport system permease protein
MFTNSNQRISVLHRLDVRTKLCWFVAVITLAFLFVHPIFGLVTVLLLIGLTRYASIPFTNIKRLIALLVPILVIMFFVTSFSFSPEDFATERSKEILFYLFPGETAPLTVGGILTGIALILRILIMVLSTILLTYTTPVDDFLHFFRKLRVPHTITFIITTAIRFIPTMETKARMVMDAQRSRGAPLGTGNIITRIRSYLPIMIPVIVDSIRMSENLAVGILNRGFDATKPFTVLEDIKFSKADYVLTLIGITILVLGIYLYYQDILTI